MIPVDAPVAPVDPVAPVEPVEPVEPVAPVLPVLPVAPVAPDAPPCLFSASSASVSSAGELWPLPWDRIGFVLYANATANSKLPISPEAQSVRSTMNCTAAPAGMGVFGVAKRSNVV